MLPMVVSFAAPRGQNAGLSADYRDPGEVAAYGLAVCIFSAFFLVIPAASPWVFAVLAFLVPQFKRKFLPALLTVLALAMLVAAQEISGDTANYVRAFQQLSETDDVLATAHRWSASAEPVFWYVTYWVNAAVGENLRVTLFFWAFVSMGATALGFRLVSREAFPLALALFFSTIYFHYVFGNAMRQGAATGLLVLALGCVCQGKRRGGQLFALLAVGCHFTAIVMLPFFFVKPNSNNSICLLLLVAALISILLMASWGIWIDLAIRFAPVGLLGKLDKYFGDYSLSDTLLSFNSLRMIFFGIVVCLVLRSGAWKVPHFEIVAAFTIYVFIMQIAVAGSDIVFDRLALYRMPAELLTYSMLIAKSRKIRALPVVFFIIPLYAIISGIMALGVEGYWEYSGQTLLSAFAILVA